MDQKHTLAVLVDNSAGVLTRVAGLFSRRGFNIDSLAVGETQDQCVSRMTIVVKCDNRLLEQVVEQLRKLQCVRSLEVLSPDQSVTRELILIKVRADSSRRAEVIQIANVFRARIIDVGRYSMVLELTGEPDKTLALTDLMSDFGILEIARTGIIALERGADTIHQ